MGVRISNAKTRCTKFTTDKRKTLAELGLHWTA
ncbi:helicase [Streptomyces klenkii]|uniref:Helicase n=1 Tax=Streptomyces klenkii TaxID=1420899 RepID=A0A3B0C076_9ACTN|nr:helicase [Streptomyces klenkii]